jgi:hypothetical protein
VPVWNLSKHLFIETVSKQQGSLLVAGRTARSLPAGECHEELFFAVRTSDTSETFFEIAALNELVDG